MPFALWVSPAVADPTPGFALNRFEPAERGSRFFVLDSLDFSRVRPAAVGLVVDYASQPLVGYNNFGRIRTNIVERQLVSHLGASVVLGSRVRLAADLPAVLYATGHDGTVRGTTFLAPAERGLGDLRVTADVRVVGHAGGPLTAAFGVRAHLPMGSREAYATDGQVRIGPQAMFAGRAGLFRWAARAHYVLRSNEINFAGPTLASEFGAAAGFGVQLFRERLFIGPELFTNAAASGGFVEKGLFGAEAMLGARLDVSRSWRVGVAGGRGLTEGIGTPAYRAAASIEWVPFEEPRVASAPPVVVAPPPPPVVVAPPPPPPPPPPVVVAPPAPPPPPPPVVVAPPPPPPPPVVVAPPPPDGDRDSVPDVEDACPTEPGVRKADPKVNGCPEGKVVAGQIVLDNIRFKTDSDVILPESDATLNKVLGAIRSLPPTTNFRIEGHTDSAGNAWANRVLSQRRATSVVKWMVVHGEKMQRFDTKGFGPDKPVAPNGTEEGRKQNRRVEIHLVDPNSKAEAAVPAPVKPTPAPAKPAAPQGKPTPPAAPAKPAPALAKPTPAPAQAKPPVPAASKPVAPKKVTR